MHRNRVVAEPAVLPGHMSVSAAVLVVSSFAALFAPITRAEEPAAGAASPQPVPAVAQLTVAIEQLDAPSFDARNKATDTILAHGKTAIPYLVSALGSGARERQFRASELLRAYYTFDDVAPRLLVAVKETSVPAARSILRERAVRQIYDATTLASAEKLFAFWGTSLTVFRRDALNQLAEARTGPELAAAVAPILDLKAKASRFEEVTTQMVRHGLSYKSQYSATYVVARLFAQGLLSDDQDAIRFAERYVGAIQQLATTLQARGLRNSELRKEISDRAVYSQGAVAFLAQTLDAKSPLTIVLTDKLGISSQRLRDEFFRGLGAVDSRECYRRIGKTHIADMLVEIVAPWDDLPTGGSVAQLIHAVVATIDTGNKPKALALLDALEACRDLTDHRLDWRRGMGARLAVRLAAGAMRAANNRAYHPTRAFHDRIIALHAIGVSWQHDAFPTQLITAYLDGADTVLAEEQRQAFDRYVRMLTLLNKANVPLDSPSLKPFIRQMRADLETEHTRIAAGLAQVMQLVAHVRRAPPPRTPEAIAKHLAAWAKKGS